MLAEAGFSFLGKRENKLIIALGLFCLLFSVDALAYSGTDAFGLDFVLTKIDDLLGGAVGVMLVIVLVATAVVMVMRGAIIPGLVVVGCTFILVSIVSVAKTVSGLIL
jgi:type IV secretory pathway VirB2 component (pilin)